MFSRVPPNSGLKRTRPASDGASPLNPGFDGLSGAVAKAT